MQETIRVLMGDYGNLAVFFLIMIENLFPPIPSEVILTFGGFMTTCSEMTAPGVILSATAGSLMGAVLLYLVGYLIPEEKLKELLEGRIGKLLHFRAIFSPQTASLLLDFCPLIGYCVFAKSHHKNKRRNAV